MEILPALRRLLKLVKKKNKRKFKNLGENFED